MKRILMILAGIVLTMSANVFAQGGYQIKGVVSDKMGPIIGATVLEKGTTNGVATSLDGSYTLKVASAESLVEFNYMGYATVSYKASAIPANVILEEDAELLSDVVVIGYGTVKKSDMTGSVAVVKADQINKGSITTPTSLLQGKSAGVVVTAGDGAPGSANTIRIRGGSSLKANNNPLIVIDGLPLSEVGINGMGDPLASINPNDIASFTVLKDASATAIYGSRASNGVIIITTKKGSHDNKVHVSADAMFSVSQNAKFVDVLDATEIRDLMKKVYGEESAAMSLLSDGNTDWQREIYQSALTGDANAAVSGKVGDISNYMPYRVRRLSQPDRYPEDLQDGACNCRCEPHPDPLQGTPESRFERQVQLHQEPVRQPGCNRSRCTLRPDQARL